MKNYMLLLIGVLAVIGLNTPAKVSAEDISELKQQLDATDVVWGRVSLWSARG